METNQRGLFWSLQPSTCEAAVNDTVMMTLNAPAESVSHLISKRYKLAGQFTCAEVEAAHASPDETGQYQFNVREWIN